MATREAAPVRYTVVIEREGERTIYNSYEKRTDADKDYFLHCGKIMDEIEAEEGSGRLRWPDNCMMFQVPEANGGDEAKRLILDGKARKIMDCQESQRRQAYRFIMSGEPPSDLFPPIHETPGPKPDPN